MAKLIRFCIPFKDDLRHFKKTQVKIMRIKIVESPPGFWSTRKWSQITMASTWELAGGTQTNIFCQAFWIGEKNPMFTKHWVDGKPQGMSISITEVNLYTQLSSLKWLKTPAGYGDGIWWLFFLRLRPSLMSWSSYWVRRIQYHKWAVS